MYFFGIEVMIIKYEMVLIEFENRKINPNSF